MGKTRDAMLSSGVTVGFGTSGFTMELLDVPPPDVSRGSVEVTHQGTTTWEEFVPMKFISPGEFVFTGHYDTDDDPETYIGAAAETVTITWPFPDGLATTKGTWAFTGFITNITGTGPFKDKMVGTVTVKVSGDITVTAAT